MNIKEFKISFIIEVDERRYDANIEYLLKEFAYRLFDTTYKARIVGIKELLE